MWSPSRIAEQREAKRKSKALVFINLWPVFAGILLFLWLVVLHDRPTFRQIPADIPSSVSATEQTGAMRDDAIEIVVTRDGAVYFRHEPVRLSDLAAAVQDAVRKGADKKVYISADARAKNGDVERVVDELRRAGIAEIAFLTNKRPGGGASKD